MSRYERWARRWMTWGGLVCLVAAGNAVAALNWYSIAVGFARAEAAGSTNFASAETFAQRYAFLAVMLLLVGLRLVDRPRRGDQQ